MSSEYIDQPTEYCSYWIKPPKKMAENDFISLRVVNFDPGQVTVMIVQEGHNGEIEYIKNMRFEPKSEKTYQFML